MQKKLSATIFAQSLSNKQSRERSPHKRFCQLTIWESPQPEQPLRIERLPDVLQMWDEQRFWLIHTASGLRVPGTWTLPEAEVILNLSERWNWTLDDKSQVACGLQLMALADMLCERSQKRQGKLEVKS